MIELNYRAVALSMKNRITKNKFILESFLIKITLLLFIIPSSAFGINITEECRATIRRHVEDRVKRPHNWFTSEKTKLTKDLAFAYVQQQTDDDKMLIYAALAIDKFSGGGYNLSKAAKTCSAQIIQNNQELLKVAQNQLNPIPSYPVNRLRELLAASKQQTAQNEISTAVLAASINQKVQTETNPTQYCQDTPKLDKAWWNPKKKQIHIPGDDRTFTLSININEKSKKTTDASLYIEDETGKRIADFYFRIQDGNFNHDIFLEDPQIKRKGIGSLLFEIASQQFAGAFQSVKTANGTFVRDNYQAFEDTYRSKHHKDPEIAWNPHDDNAKNQDILAATSAMFSSKMIKKYFNLDPMQVTTRGGSGEIYVTFGQSKPKRE